MKKLIHLSAISSLFLMLYSCTPTDPATKEGKEDVKVEVKAPTPKIASKKIDTNVAASSLAAAPINKKGNPQELFDHFLKIPDRFFREGEGDGMLNYFKRNKMIENYKEKVEIDDPLSIQVLEPVQGDYFAFGMNADEGYSGHFVAYELKDGKKAYLLVEDQSDDNRKGASFHLFLFERDQMIPIPTGLQALEWPEVFAPKVFQQLPENILTCEPQADVYFDPSDRHIHYSFNSDLFIYNCPALQDEKYLAHYDQVMNGIQPDAFSYQWSGRKFKKVK